MENARDSIILAADLPDYARIESRDKDRAEDLASQFHQVFGECVYAYGGTVNDTLGSIVIAELSDPTQAFHCVENLKKRVRAELAGQAALTPRAVLTSGQVYEKDFSLAGRAVQNALAILDSLKKDQMLVSADLVGRSGNVAHGDPVLKLGETGYFEVPLSKPAPPPKAVPAVSAAAAPTADGEGSEEAVAPVPKKPKTGLIIAAVAVLLLIAGGAFWFLSRPEAEPMALHPAEPPPAPAPVDPTIRIAMGGFVIAPEAGVAGDLSAAEPLVAALLGSIQDVEISSGAENRVGADVRMIPAVPGSAPEGTNGEPSAPAGAQPEPVPAAVPAVEPEPRVVPWVEKSGERFEGPDAPYDGLWSVVVPTMAWAGEQLDVPTAKAVPQSPELRRAFRALVSPDPAAPAAGAARKYAALYEALSKEPEFLPGWLLLAEAETGDPALDPAILDALRNVSRLEPARVELARDLGRRELAEGTLAGAVEAFSRVRAAEPRNDEANRVIALAALAAHQPERYREAAGASSDRRLHVADVEVSEGKIDAAVKQYYETEAEVKDNPYLAFKIGRIAVLRRSSQIAQIEMDRLDSLGTEPQRSLMKAYMAADAGDRTAAMAALEEARKHADWSDSAWFHSAEVYAILRDAGKTLEALERAVDRREPMMHAIATNPLFRYLANEARFREAVRKLLANQRNITAALER